MGKFPHEFLKRFFTDHDDERIIVGPRYGEDAAVLDFGEEYLIVHPDPISGAVKHIGWLSVHIPANDIAVTGAEPRWALPTVQVPEDMEFSEVEDILEDISHAADDLNISLIGGHTEKVDFLDRPMVTTCMMGVTTDPIFTHSSRPGDLIVQVGAGGIEGTWVLASDLYDVLVHRGIDPTVLKSISDNWRDDVSVVKNAGIFRDISTSMHDATEGGILQGLYEMALASQNRFEVSEELLVREETVEICRALEIDPFRLISSGCLLATVPPETEIPMGKVIGEVKSGGPSLIYEGESVQENTEDELFKVLGRGDVGL